MNPDQTFYEMMSHYADFLEEMVRQEDQKQAALCSYDVERMNQSVQAQQATLMRLEGLEKQRIELQRRAGYDKLTFGQLLERLEGAEHERFLALFVRVQKAVSLIQQLNDRSVEFAAKSLQIINGSVPEELQGGYDAARKKTPGATVSLFEAKV